MSLPLAPSMMKLGCTGIFGCGCVPVPVRRVAQHGTRAKYQSGCSCDPCVAANARYQAAYRKAKKEYDHTRNKRRKEGTWKASSSPQTTT